MGSHLLLALLSAAAVLLCCLVPSALAQEEDRCFALGGEPYPIRARPDCPPGYYCPNIDPVRPRTWAQVCPPSVSCQLDRLAGKFCDAQGTYEPTVCLAGYYCSNYTLQEICPKGHYCPLGSVAPIPCDPLAWCGEGARTQVYYGGVLIVLIIDLFLGIAYAILIRLDLKAQNSLPVVDEEKQKLVAGAEELASGFERGCLGKRLDLQFEGLSHSLPNGKVILSGVTGHIQPGRVTAVMGPSGAGKTTFLNVLMGKVPRTGGSLFLNGKEAEINKYKKVIGYVPQEDIMLRELTVLENISYSARIRLPRWSSKDIEAHISSVVRSLGLEHVQHIPIGDETTRGISGGQRKRVNIGLELAACPIALFLDEPTSGLDSTAALSVCETLKNIASLGMTVVAVIHQPRFEIFESFDDILLLAPGGRTTYIGPQSGVIGYFQSLGYEFPPKINPADVLMDIVAGKVSPSTPNSSPVDLVARWELQDLQNSANIYEIRKGSINDLLDEETNPGRYPPPKTRTLRDRIKTIAQDNTITSESLESIARDRGANFFKQIYLSHNRSIVQQYRKFFSFGLEIFVGTLAGIMIGGATLEVESSLYQGVLAGAFVLISPAPLEVLLPQLGLLISMAIGVAGAPAGVTTFGEEKVVYWREAACGHNKLAYYIGKTLSTIFRITMSSFHFAAFFYVLCRPLTPFWSFYAIILLTFACVYGLAAVVSMLVPRENAPLLSVIAALIMATLCGYGPTLKLAQEFKLKWIFDMSYNRWGVEAFYDSETRLFRDLMRVEEVSAPFFGFTLDRFAFDLGLMVVMTVALRIIAFLLLILVQRRKQE